MDEAESQLVVVANRLPVEPVYLDGDPDQEVIGWRLAPGGLVRPQHQPHRCGFARAVGPQEPCDLTVGYLKGQVIHSNGRPVGLP